MTTSDPTTDPTAEVVIGIDRDNAFFWEATAQERVVAQRCAACARVWFPPGPVCPHCGDLEWTVAELPQEGTIYSAAKVHAPGSPIQGTDYLIVLVAIPDPERPGEGVRMAGNLRDASLAEATIGAAVSVHFEALAGEHRLPQFHLAATR